jgi:Family of unknown function (DUF6541)
MSALISLLLVFVLPTAAGCVLLSGPPPADSPDDPGETSGDDADHADHADHAASSAPYTVLARGIACGFAAWLIGSGVIAATVDLTVASTWAWDAAVAATSIVVLALPRSRARLRAVLGPVGRRFAESAGLAALVYVPLGSAVVATSWSPLGSTPWYYYGLAQQVADAGSVPATSIEFATTVPFLNDYHLFTTGTALLLVQDAAHPITVITIVTLLGVLLLGVGAAALTAALGAGRLTALLAVPIAVSTGIGPARLAAYRPEGFSLGLSLLLVALAIDWLRRRDWRSLVAAALIAATLSQVHGIAALAAAVLIAAAAIVSAIQEPLVEQLRRTAAVGVALVGAVAVTGLVFREASGTVHAGGLVDTGGIADPTWEFFMAARDDPPSVPQGNAAMVVDTVRGMYASWSWVWIVLVLVVSGVGLYRRRSDRTVRRLVGFTVVALVGLAAVACVFMFGWKGYVPRRTGGSRMVLEASLLVPPFAAIGLAAFARDRAGRHDSRVRVRRRKLVLSMLGALCVLGLITLSLNRSYNAHQRPTRDELATWESLPLTSGDVVLANGYTEGFIPIVTGAEGLLDGRAPYTFATVLKRANSLLRGGASFFDDPAANWDFLADNNVTWVVVGDDDSHSLATANVWETPANLDALDGCTGLEQVVRTDTLTAYRVTDPGPDGCALPSGS